MYKHTQQRSLLGKLLRTDLQPLILMCGCAVSVMLLTLAVVLPTPHDSSGTLQEGYSARFNSQPQGRLIREQEGLCTLYSIEH